MSAQQEEQFIAFEDNNVDEVMQILSLMSSEDKDKAKEGLEAANK